MLTWTWIIQVIVISIILIFLVHHLINFFKSVLTIPKTKDLVNTSQQKYKDIYDVIMNGNNIKYTQNEKDTNMNFHYNLEDILPNSNSSSNSATNSTTSIDDINMDNININSNSNNMKDELKNFLKNQLKNTMY